MKSIEIANSNYKLLLFLSILGLVLLGCKSKDLRSSELKENGIRQSDIRYGKQLLQSVVELQNLEKLEESPTYSLIAKDEWFKQYGMNINPWPGDNGALLEFKHAFGTFDGKVKWLETDKKNTGYGIQSWQLYEYGTSEVPKQTENEKLEFIIPTMQYFMELPYRLSNAPIISYMGTSSSDSAEYEIVFVTWDSPTPNEYDQYTLYINKETGLIDRTTYTIRDNFMWTPKNFYGTATYSDYREVQGVLFPFKIDIYPFDKVGKKKVHSFTVKSISLNDFNIEELYPFSDLPRMGDSK